MVLVVKSQLKGRLLLSSTLLENFRGQKKFVTGLQLV